ncbi:MAG: recombinase family protein, partial [Dysosmobacter welbionis]
STILRILEDERYTGVYVIGKRAVLEVGGTRSHLKDRESWYIIPDHHPAIVEKAVFDTVQASQLRFSQPNKKKRDYPLKGKAFCGCCGHALSRTMQKTSYYYCRHSEADVESRCHKMRLNAAELEQAVFLTLKKQMEAAAPFAPDGSLRVDASVPERAEYEQQIETLQDGKRTLYEHYLMGEIDLNTYKAEKAACNELLLKTKNAYAAVLAQAKQKQDEQARQDSRKEASKAIFDADTLTTELAELLIDRVLVYPDKRIEIAYKIQDIFD